MAKKKSTESRTVRRADINSVLKAVEDGKTNLVKDYCYHGGFTYNIGRRQEVVPPTVCHKVDPGTLQCTAYCGEYTSPTRKCRPIFNEDGSFKECKIGCAFSPVANYDIVMKFVEEWGYGKVNPLKASKRARRGK